VTDTLYGLFTAEAIKTLSDPKVFEAKSIEVDNQSNELSLAAK